MLNGTLPSPEEAARLLGGEVFGGQILCPGPGHSKNDRSLSVKYDRLAPGGFVVNSFSGDDPIACKDHVRERLGLGKFEPAAQAPSQPEQKPKRRVVATYEYAAEDGELLFNVLRYEPKGFSQQRPTESGMVPNMDGVKRVLYRLPELLEAVAQGRAVYVCEGEKAVDALRKLGFVATCSSGGAGKWTKTDFSPLQGADVVVLPDNDEPGRKHAQDVKRSLEGMAKSVRIARLPGLPDKGDVADWIAAGGTTERFNDLMAASDSAPEEAPAEQPRRIRARPFTWRDPATIPPRPFIMGKHYIRGYSNSTIAPSGVGKSSVAVVEILQLVTGRRLISEPPRKPQRVLYFGEDPYDEIEKRFLAAMKAYGIPASEVEGWLFFESFRDMPVCIGTAAGANRKEIADLIAEVREREIDVLFADPISATHTVSENDNTLMNHIYRAWNDVAHQGRCAVELVRHTRKTNGQSATIDDGRGAGSQTDATRDSRTIAKMTEDEAKALHIDAGERWRYIRINDSKQNMAPPADKGTWWELTGVFLGNATDDPDADNQKEDNVQVVRPWAPPKLFDEFTSAQCDAALRIIQAGDYRRSDQSKKGVWAGTAIAPALGLDPANKRDKGKLKAVIDRWVDNDVLLVEMREDDNRDKRPFVVVGEWNFTTPAPRQGGGDE